VPKNKKKSMLTSVKQNYVPKALELPTPSDW